MAGPWEKYSRPVAAPQSEPAGEGPWSKYQAPSKPADRSTEAAVEGFGRGVPVVGSYLPQLQAGAEKVAGTVLDPSGGVDEDLKRQGFNVQGPDDSYVAARDRYAKRSEELQAAHPTAFAAGQVAGTVAGSAIPAAGLSKAPIIGRAFAAPAKGVVGRLAQGAAAGGIVGGLENPGDMEGEVSDNLSKRWENAKSGLGYGLAAGAVGEGIAKTAKGVAERAGKAAEGYAFKAAGANKGDIKRSLTKNVATKVANVALNETVDILDDATGKVVKERLVSPGDTIEDVASKVGKLRQQTGEKISQVYDDVANELASAKPGRFTPEQAKVIRATNFQPVQYAEELRTSLGNELKGKAGGTAALSRVNGVLDDLAANGESAGIKEMHAFRQSVDDLINYDKTLTDLPIATQKLKQVRDFINDKIKARVEAFDKVVGGTKAADLKKANELYSSVAELDRMAKGGLAGEQSRAFMGFLDRQSALGGAAIGLGSGLVSDDPESRLTNAAIYGVGGALASRAARRYGPATMARVSSGAAKAFKSAPSMAKDAIYASRRSPVAVGAAAGGAAAKTSQLLPPAPRQDEETQPQILGAPPAERAPTPTARGEEKWAQSGLQKLKQADRAGALRDPTFVDDLLKSPQGRQLLIEASDLEPGSRAFNRVMQRISEMKGPNYDSRPRAETEVLRRKREPARRR